METLYDKALALYKEFESTLPEQWYMNMDFFSRSEEVMFEAFCQGWLSYGLRFITEFDNIILLICRYGGGECGAYSVELEPENEIKDAIEDWLDKWNIKEESINFEFIHLDDDDDEDDDFENEELNKIFTEVILG